MSAAGHELSIHHPGQNSNLATAYPSTADLLLAAPLTQFVPRADSCIAANYAHPRCVIQSLRHSITSSAWASSVGEIVRPSALAVLRLMTRSNLVGCSIGKSPGLAPLRIWSARIAARLK